MKQSPSFKQEETSMKCMLNFNSVSFCFQHWRRCWTWSCDVF